MSDEAMEYLRRSVALWAHCRGWVSWTEWMQAPDDVKILLAEAVERRFTEDAACQATLARAPLEDVLAAVDGGAAKRRALAMKAMRRTEAHAL